jgi:hypothetical protein
MKKLFIVFILFVSLFPKLDAQIFYNIEKPLSYQKQGLIDIQELPSIKFDVGITGNLVKDKISLNLNDYLKIEKNGDKIIARIKFNVASLSLGEMTLRFKDVKLNNGAYCYVYTSDYQIVAGPIYQKSINDILNIIKIPANELVLEIVSNSEQDYNLIFSSISFQSVENIKQKSKNSLQEDLSNWDCVNYGIDGNPKYCDNISSSYSDNSASYLGAWYDCDLLKLQNLYSINDENIAASRASCIIMEPPHLNTEPPNNWIDYWGANSGTLMNFPEIDCKGIIFTAYHLGFIKQICDYTILANNKQISTSQQEVLDNTIIRFNWHHKYGKPLHLVGCSQNDFALWRKTIDFDEVIDYCGVRGVAYVPNTMGFPDYAILEMNQTPFYKELHLGWTTQRIYDFNSSTDLNNPGDFSILGRHGATPTYLFKNSGGFVERMGDWAAGIQLQVIDDSDPALPQQPPPDSPRVRSFSGWSGSQLLYPYYENESERIGLGITKSGTTTDIISYTYRYIFYHRDCYIIDTSLTIASPNTGDDLYNKYLKLHTDEFIIEDDFFWVPSVENRQKCPSPEASVNEPCDFHFGDYIKVVPLDGKLYVTINIGSINQANFPGDHYPKGIRIYNASTDQQTFYFDTFVDNIAIPTTIEFIVDECDLFYYQMIGLTSLTLGFDFYDANGKILNAPGCNMTYSFPFSNINPCSSIKISTESVPTPPPCCSYKISIKFEGCKDYSFIFRNFLENSSLINSETDDTTALSSQNSFNTNYETGEISFFINNVCDSITYKLVKSFGNGINCGIDEFNLGCPFGYPLQNCCLYYYPRLLPVFEADSNDFFEMNTKKFMISFWDLENDGIVWPQCFFDSSIVYCPNPAPYISQPIYNETLKQPEYGFFNNGFVSLAGLTAGTYCFYFERHTSSGICYDTLCVDYDGFNWILNDDPQGIIIKIDDSNTNYHNSITIPTDFDYETFDITDMIDKVIIKSDQVNKIDVSNLPKGTYNILYRKRDKIVQTQKLIIK